MHPQDQLTCIKPHLKKHAGRKQQFQRCHGKSSTFASIRRAASTGEDLFVIHAFHVMTFMASFFGTIGFIFATCHSTVLVFLAATAFLLWRGVRRLCGECTC